MVELVLTILGTTLISMAGAGSLLYVMLDFALKRKLAEMNGNHEANLRKQHANHEADLKRVHALYEAQIAEALHARNTTYSRYSEKKCEVVLELHEAILRFSWLYTNLTVPNFSADRPKVHFATHVAMLSMQANHVIEIVLKSSFYFHEDFRKFVVGRWYALARKMVEGAAAAGMACEENFEFDKYSNERQIDTLKAELEKWEDAHKEEREAMQQARSHISAFLEMVFKDSTPLQSNRTTKDGASSEA